MQNEGKSTEFNEFSRSDNVKLRAILTTYSRYLHFQGYSSRREYLWNLFGLGVPILFFLLLYRMHVFIFIYIPILFLIVSFFPLFALLSRRYADAALPRLCIMPLFLVFVPIPLYIQVTAVVAVFLPTILPTRTLENKPSTS